MNWRISYDYLLTLFIFFNKTLNTLSFRSSFALMFPFKIVLCTIHTFLILIFGIQTKNSSINPTIFNKSIEISETRSSKDFNDVMTAYQEFYGNLGNNLSVKMGDRSSIIQRIKLKYDNDVLEIVYEERIFLEGNKLSINVEIVDIYFYNKSRTRFKKLKTDDIRRNSKRGKMLLHYIEDIKVKCEKLLTHLAS